MKKNIPLAIYLLVELLVAAFIFSSVGTLPDFVVSHFRISGEPNGFMSHDAYVGFMLFTAIGIPALVVGTIPVLLRLAPGSINIPNRDYWLAPAQRQATTRYLNGHMPWVGSLVSLFMGYVHWLIMQANSVQPPRLPGNQIFPGLGLFLAGVIVWSVLLLLRFGRLPKP